jgi:hypothetical protein
MSIAETPACISQPPLLSSLMGSSHSSCGCPVWRGRDRLQKKKTFADVPKKTELAFAASHELEQPPQRGASSSGSSRAASSARREFERQQQAAPRRLKPALTRSSSLVEQVCLGRSWDGMEILCPLQGRPHRQQDQSSPTAARALPILLLLLWLQLSHGASLRISTPGSSRQDCSAPEAADAGSPRTLSTPGLPMWSPIIADQLLGYR